MVEHESVDQLSYADRKIIDKICDEFESAFLSGSKPDLKEYVTELPKTLLLPGLVELVTLDAFYSRQTNEISTHKSLSHQTVDCSNLNGLEPPHCDLWQNYVATFPALADVTIPAEFQIKNDEATLFDGRFKSIRNHANGGLGRISIASDLQFKRNVAVKEIHSAYADQPTFQRRFLREAEITGQLEHPGVVPVYVLGRRENDAPYYAMRFIRGQSMFDAIGELHHLPGESSFIRIRRKLLNQIIHVCNTVEYAHSKSIIHRDIKPQNIMLGDFGETLLVDWGLAKRLSETDEPVIKPETSNDDQYMTRSGSVLGTVGYMSPEQANGDNDIVGFTSDVYSLGATMFHLLTGKPAPAFKPEYSKSSWATFLQSSMNGSGLSRPMKAICCKAMALESSERYQSAKVLAADIERALADEPVSVCSDSIWTGGRRWIQRNPAFSAAAMVTACLVFLGLSIFAWLSNAHSFQVELKNDQLDKLYEQEKVLRRVAQDSEVRTSNALDFLSDMLRSPDPNKKGRDVRVVDQLATAIAKLDLDYKDDPLLQAKVLNEIGFTYYSLSEYTESSRLLERARSLYAEHAGANDSRTLIAGKNLGNAWLRLKDDRAFELLNDVYHRANSSLGPEDPLTLSFHRSLAEAMIEQGDVRNAINELESMVPTFRRVHDESSAESMSLQSSLAKAYAAAGQNSHAAKLTEMIHKRRIEHNGVHSLAAITSGYNHVKFLRKTNRRNEAVTLLESLLSNARKGLGNDHYQTILLVKELGQSYLAVADREKGIPLVEEAWQRITALYGEDHALSVTTANSLGFAYIAQGNYVKASEQFESTYQRTLRIYGPKHVETLTLANNLAMAFQLGGQFESAIELFETTIDSQTKTLGRGHPKTILSLLNYAGALRNTDRYADAIPVCLEVVELALAIEKDHYYSRIAMLIEGAVRLRLEDFTAAQNVLSSCHESFLRSAPDHWQRYHTMSLLGEAKMGLKDFAAAEPLLIEGFETLVKLESTIPNRVKSKVSEAKIRLVKLYEAMNMLQKAALYRAKRID